ncbi:unnamed protein product, partial [Laminaria digitata]
PTAASPGPAAANGPKNNEDAEPNVELIYHDAEYTWDAQRRLHIKYKLKYKLLRASAIESQWAVIATSWAPWHREQPKLTATVTRPDGSVYTLDPKTLE